MESQNICFKSKSTFVEPIAYLGIAILAGRTRMFNWFSGATKEGLMLTAGLTGAASIIHDYVRDGKESNYFRKFFVIASAGGASAGLAKLLPDRASLSFTSAFKIVGLEGGFLLLKSAHKRKNVRREEEQRRQDDVEQQRLENLRLQQEEKQRLDDLRQEELRQQEDLRQEELRQQEALRQQELRQQEDLRQEELRQQEALRQQEQQRQEALTRQKEGVAGGMYQLALIENPIAPSAEEGHRLFQLLTNAVQHLSLDFLGKTFSMPFQAGADIVVRNPFFSSIKMPLIDHLTAEKRKQLANIDNQ